MADPQYLPNLTELESALTTDSLDEVREILLRLDDDERELLRLELGSEVFQQLFRVVGRQRRTKLGRVIVIHGIMGSLLDVKNPAGKVDRIWFKLRSIADGRMRDLELTREGWPKNKHLKVKVGGLHGTYALLLMDLESRWQVKPFAFDWRQDIDQSARQLAHVIRDWSRGEPVHLVAHSMGGLVCRRVIQMFPDLWRDMLDVNREDLGGRLIQLGTPNYGSFTIPLVLTGEEKIVKWLALLDIPNSRQDLLSVISTFPGIYQMLPSSAVDLGDQHQKLFSRRFWGAHAVVERHLEGARKFHARLNVETPMDRVIYVAGCDQKTPHMIRIEEPGEFTYKITRNGDGRVPHSLGLLDNVRTFWVREKHGDLPKNEGVRNAIHELLLTGDTTRLERDRPTCRRLEEERDLGMRFLSPGEFVEDPPREVYEDLISNLRGSPQERSERSIDLRILKHERLMAAELMSGLLGSVDPAARIEIASV